MKVCTKCKQKKSIKSFSKNIDAKSGLAYWCKNCVKKKNKIWKNKNKVKKRLYDKAWKAKNPTYYPLYTAKYQYGFAGILKELYIVQKRMCPICEKKLVLKKAHIDHDHKTGDIRGILHPQCNLTIGKLGDSYEGLLRATEYLRPFALDKKIQKVVK